MSPAKPCGKGSKRKQDDVDDEEEDDDVEEQQTWVEALSQELADNDGPEVDPDYEVGIVWGGGRQGSKLCCVFFSPISFMQSCKFKVVKLTPETTRLVSLACGFNFSYRHEEHLKTWPLPFF